MALVKARDLAQYSPQPTELESGDRMRIKLRNYILMFIPFVALIALLIAGFVFTIFTK